jgi:hypothetical protein
MQNDKDLRFLPLSTPGGPFASSRGLSRARESGIALMVVMVVFIILYLVVFQLHYTTRLEEKISRARSLDAQGASATRSVALSVLGLLAEDLKSSGGSPGEGAASGLPAGAGPGGPPGESAADGKKAGESQVSSKGGEPTAIPATGGGGSGWYDYLGEAIFQKNTLSLNGITVKISIQDNERGFDLNRLWEYPPSHEVTLSGQNEEKDAKEGKAGNSLLSKALEEAGAGKKTGSKTGTRTGTKSAAGAATQRNGGQVQESEEPVLEEVGAGLEWEPPTEERRQETVTMLERAIAKMYEINTENGFDYQVKPPNQRALAEAIERYAYEKRAQPRQNYLHLPSELLNVLAQMGESPEVYYGPRTNLRPGEEFMDRGQEFRYQVDEFGDLSAEYLYAEDLTLERQMMEEQLKELQGMYGQFTTFPELGRMGNPMTKNMEEYSEVEQENGDVVLMIPPMPLGLKDLFTTFSAKAKININTAPFPILYALLPLVIDTEPQGETRAQGIALNIEAYREKLQSEGGEASSSGIAGVTGKDSTSQRSGKSLKQKDAARLLGDSGAAAAAGLTPEELAAASSASGSANYSTNYFTSMEQQLKLIDGEDGSKEDYLNDQGIDSVELEKKSPLQKVLFDYKQVMDYKSNFFTATLKSKSENSPAIKTGYLTVYRNVQKKRIEIVQWIELQK